MKIDIRERNAEKIVFDIKGIEPPLANALRRIMIAEIPSIAIEKINMWQNTSIIPDENLAHRMGLVPINVDPDMLEYRKEGEEQNERNTIKFNLHVKCTKKNPSLPMALNDTANEEKLYNHANVYSSDLKWEPIGNQAKTFAKNKPKVLLDDIMIAKLRPGQEIEMELFCEKGLGKDHAKWSPVCTAWYRLVPDIRFTEDIKGEEAKQLKNLCPMGVFDIEDLGKKNSKVTVANPRNCTTCRECKRHEEFADRVVLEKFKDHFEFTVETVGVYKPETIVLKAFEVLKGKSQKWIQEITKMSLYT